MKRIYLYGLLTLSFASFTSSCDDNKFLTEYPETFYTTDNAFTTPGQVDQAVIAGYSMMRDQLCNPKQEPWLNNLRFNGTDMYDVCNIRTSNSFNNYGILNPTNANYTNIYSTFYQLSARMNLAIAAADYPHISWADPEEKAYVVAQAKVIRAFCYKNLGQLFGGVPLIKEVIETPRYDFKRSTRLETYQFAIDDLESCVNDLPQTSKSGGRIVKAVAQHYLSELYLSKGIQLEAENKGAEAKTAYTKAIEYGDAVIDGGIYSLMTSRFGMRRSDNPTFYYDTKQTLSYESAIGPTPGNVIWDLFQDGNINYQDGNRECIWAFQIDYEAYKAEDKMSVLPYSANSPILRDASKAKNYVAGLLEDVGGRGVSWVMPTMYTRDSIYNGKWEKDLRNSEAVFRRKILGNKANTEYYGKVVPWSVFYATANDQSLCYPISCKIATDRYTGLADGQNRSNLFRDEYMIRLPETILLRAEAKMRNGNLQGAADDINLLRNRAQCGYLVNAGDVTVDLILDERARELVYEEWRWNTLLRMGGKVATDRIKKYAYWDVARASLTFDFNLFPIPQTVIDTNKDNLIEQNPGWDKR